MEIDDGSFNWKSLLHVNHVESTLEAPSLDLSPAIRCLEFQVKNGKIVDSSENTKVSLPNYRLDNDKLSKSLASSPLFRGWFPKNLSLVKCILRLRGKVNAGLISRKRIVDPSENSKAFPLNCRLDHCQPLKSLTSSPYSNAVFSSESLSYNNISPCLLEKFSHPSSKKMLWTPKFGA